MKESDKPNLFTYATSELSQDAFICGLAAWADPKFKTADPALHQVASDFIASLIHRHKPHYDVSRINSVNVERQVEKLDVLIKIIENSDDKLAILIEDKTHTDHHSGQLGRYYENATKSFAIEQIIPIYFKTGYQSKFDVGNYKTYLRKDFLALLKSGSERVKNAIYSDFLSHLEHMEYVVNQYSVKDLIKTDGSNGWDPDDWRGFFMSLYDKRNQLYEVTEDDTANWSYIANPSGGFFGFWWYFKTIQNSPFTPYLQLENDALCFKIEVKDETKRQESRGEAYQKLTEASSQLGVELSRPTRMGSGRYMTVLRWKGDYRSQKDNKLDFDATLENLKKAQQILDTAFPQ
ncbi:PD-(D/E)XK nuclease family protein [Spirosoma radiotolerans]|nr:PD-(D/E)XK nuclease family protein [Spirosoma radiotolerans]